MKISTDAGARIGNVSGAVIVAALLVYAFAGLAMSAENRVSWLAAPAALIGALVVFGNVGRAIPIHRQFLVAYGVIALSWVWAPFAVNFREVIFYLVGVLGSYLIAASITSGIISLRSGFLFFCIPAIANIFAYIVGINYTEVVLEIDPTLADGRFSGFVGHPNSLVTRMISPLVFVVAFFPIIKKPSEKLVGTGLALIFVVMAIVMTGSKKSILMAVPALGALYFRLNNDSLGVSRLLAKAYILGLALFIFSAGSLYYSGAFDDFQVVARIEQALQGRDESTLEREDLVGLGLQAFAMSPIYGHGFGSFAYVTGAGVYSHNNLIELLVNGGVLSAAAYYFVVFNVFRALYLSRQGVLFLVCLGFFLVTLDITGVSYSDRGSSSAIGILLALQMTLRPQTKWDKC